MKSPHRVVALILLFLVAMSASFANADSGKSGTTYNNGVEGLMAGTTPPPGIYLRWYNLYTQAGQTMDSKGKEIPMGLKVGAMATVPRLIFVPERKFKGANIVTSVLVPVVNLDLKVGAANYHQRGTHLGDMDVTTVLQWHKPRYDFGFGADWVFPTGANDDVNATKPGSNEYTIMPCMGVTYFLDPKRKWNASGLFRFEHHFKKINQDVQMGNDFHFEWGLGRSLGKGIMVGPVGYAQWKVSDDSGTAVTWNPRLHDRVFAAGPEIMMPVPGTHWLAQFRGIAEFGARSHTQSNGFAIVLTKRFDSGDTARK